jgi:hypothetical protein
MAERLYPDAQVTAVSIAGRPFPVGATERLNARCSDLSVTTLYGDSMPPLGRWPWTVVGAGDVFSHCGTYRYLLWHRWDAAKPLVGVSGINPSSATGKDHDHTTRKLRGFGDRLGWGGFLLGNPFALVSTDQRGLLAADAPIGPENDKWLRVLFSQTDHVIAAWGSAKTAAVRRLLDKRLTEMGGLLASKPLLCFGRSADGSPRHPLMLAYSTPLESWSAT